MNRPRYRVHLANWPEEFPAASLAEARRIIADNYGRTFRVAAGNVNAPSWHHYHTLRELRDDPDGGRECAIVWPVAEGEA